MPTGAIVAITSLCNANCIMCNFGKSKRAEFIDPNIVRKLPSNLKSIDITGGEPFLHSGLIQILREVKQSCPKARVLITTNGILTERVAKLLPKIKAIDNRIAFRVSLDALSQKHDQIRRVPGSFGQVMLSLRSMKKLGFKDVGVIFTLMQENFGELDSILAYCKENHFNFSMNLVHDSEIYFGDEHQHLRPSFEKTREAINRVIRFYRFKYTPRNLFKNWFYRKLIIYSETRNRPIGCGAGENFFYLDWTGKISICHFKNAFIGDLGRQSFTEIWNSGLRRDLIKIHDKCNDCFMVCTTKNNNPISYLKFIAGGLI